jgi:ornithine cyclodeaminase/alanine dehydrogenase
VPLYLTEVEVGELLSPAEATEAVAASLARAAMGEVENAARIRLAAPDGNFAVMPCVDRGLGVAGLKTFAWSSQGARSLVLLFAVDEPRVEAILEADRLGPLRTAGASAVAARHLARSGASTLGVLGCGLQAAAHVAALRIELPALDRVLVYCRQRDRLAAFCAEYACEPAESHRDAAECDVVITATTSRDPVVRGEWLVPGALVCAVGANDPESRELDNVVLERATFVCCDSRAQSQLEAGDLIEPVARGVLDWLEVHELQDVVTGELSGRAADDDIVLFKANGVPSWDLAAGVRAVQLARERGLGREL